jgi:hypothetical protein
MTPSLKTSFLIKPLRKYSTFQFLTYTIVNSAQEEGEYGTLPDVKEPPRRRPGFFRREDFA